MITIVEVQPPKYSFTSGSTSLNSATNSSYAFLNKAADTGSLPNADLLVDVAEFCDENNLEFALKYEDNKGYDKFTITEVFEG